MKKILYCGENRRNIVFFLKKANVLVFDLIQEPEYRDLVKSVDGLVLEITQKMDNFEYLLMQGLLKEKPILCLYQKNREPREILSDLQSRGVPSYLKCHAYTEQNLEKIILRFLGSVGVITAKEKPIIKFTLRMTEAINQYLNWHAQYKKKNKAASLRQLIELQMQNDEIYQNYLQQKK